MARVTSAARPSPAQADLQPPACVCERGEKLRQAGARSTLSSRQLGLTPPWQGANEKICNRLQQACYAISIQIPGVLYLELLTGDFGSFPHISIGCFYPFLLNILARQIMSPV